LFRHESVCAEALARPSTDKSNPARIAMTAMATSNSIKVNAREVFIEFVPC
jgi:hypothetical protein